MKNDTFCFVACVSDEQLYEECLYYINHLKVPAGYKVETLAIKDASAITNGYNEAIQKSDAKYKVYLHQDFFIINPKLIYDLLSIFQSEDKIGMIGLIGAKALPPDGIWWEGERKFGMVYDNHTGTDMSLISFEKPTEQYVKVQAIDGILMATQYDFPFRSDLFDGWDFYDISQSFEFARKGYQVVVPSTKTSWGIHDCGLTQIGKDYDQYRRAFLQEYAQDMRDGPA